jgi:hypothetical protein
MNEALSKAYSGSVRWRIEGNDCTVRTAATLLDIDYDRAHGIMQQLGRKPRRGFKFSKFAKAYHLEELGDLRRRRVKTVLSKLTSGRFAVRIAKHVFTVVDGQVVSDRFENKPLSLVKDVWQYRRERWLPVKA